jgi:hypothetical protein
VQSATVIVLIVLTTVCVYLAARGSGAGELWSLLATTLLIILTFVIQRARVLTVPLGFVWIITALFWSARRSAEREDEG